MVRKIIFVFLFAVFIFHRCAKAESYDVYYGTISSTYTNIYRDLAEGLAPGDKYVVWRNDENDYVMYVGSELTVDDGTFTGGEGKIYSLSSERWTGGSGTSYQTYYDYSFRDIDSLTLNTNDILVYSSLPGYPILHEGGQAYDSALLFVVICALIVIILLRVFRSGR